MEARARYLASVEELETIDYLLEDHEIGLEPRKTNMPVVDFRPVGSLANLHNKTQREYEGQKQDKSQNECVSNIKKNSFSSFQMSGSGILYELT